VIFTFAGDGTTDFKGDGGPATAAGLYAPDNVGVDSAGNVYIADRNHGRIRKVTPNGVINTVAGNGSIFYNPNVDNIPATSATLVNPAGVVTDGLGNLFISDRDDNRVRVVAPNGIINTFAGNGSNGFSGDGGQATLAQINFPIGLATDAAENVFIADWENNRIRKVTPNGIITTVAGNGTQGFGGDGGQATAASLYSPSGVAVDASGNLLIADFGNMRIRKVTPAGIITTFAGSGSYGSGGDGGPAIQAQFIGPTGIAIDHAGNIVIADSGSNRVRKIDSTGIITTIAGLGGSDPLGDGGPGVNASLVPTDLAFDPSGNLLVTDAAHNRVRIIFFTAPTIKRRGGQVTSQ
jgi:sugar lactone lactonase YvrE